MDETIIVEGLKLLALQIEQAQAMLYLYGGDNIGSALIELRSKHAEVIRAIGKFKPVRSRLEVLCEMAEAVNISANSKVVVVSVAESDVAYGSVRPVENGEIYQAIQNAFDEIERSMSALNAAECS